MRSKTPSGLVLSTSKSLQSYDELVECDVENFLEYIDELAEKAVLIKHKEEPRRGIIIKPCDSSRYFPGGKRKAKRNIRKRIKSSMLYPDCVNSVVLIFDIRTIRYNLKSEI